jgi:hypothetical protein
VATFSRNVAIILLQVLQLVLAKPLKFWKVGFARSSTTDGVADECKKVAL